ncbi:MULTISPECIES: alpha/beta fold hydrolase [unclassified Nocardioides]|uniref:alpha/beta fold hydrolase n=1 Tax=unclassified Nocardioides TaxID=2615069 RepID=UPI00005702C7|nr:MULTISPECIES: alpha/beta fold hydrolase [unclassified Nocardioides]ABL80356.1 3-oxoadipate enol-lactonase [Nocardioides sp. JS614]
MASAPTGVTVTTLELTVDRDAPLLVVGPSLGTSVESLWSPCARLLSGRFHVVGWDLPGHGSNPSIPATGLSIAELAAAVAAAVGELLVARGRPEGPFGYAGDSVGGAVGLQLLLDHPDLVSSAVLVCTGARIGTPAGWRERAENVRQGGTAAVLAGSLERWFAPGFTHRHDETTRAFTRALLGTHPSGYAAVCAALERFDVTDRLHEIAQPVLAVAGEHDVSTPPASLETIARGVRRGRLVVLPDVAHLAPSEDPVALAELISAHVAATPVARVTTRSEPSNIDRTN